MNSLPIIVAILAGIATYVVGVLLIPKKITDEGTNFTRKQLKGLEQNDIGLAYELENDLMRDRYQSKGLLAKIYYAMPLGKFSHSYIVRAGMADAVDKLFMIFLGVFVLSLVAIPALHISKNGIVIVIGAIVVTYVVAWRIIQGKIKRRIRSFISQFPDALDIIVRSVKSGFPLNAAVNMVAESMPAPTNEEFRQMSTEVVHGSTLVDALERMGQRMQTPDIRFFVVVLTLQQEVGGSLAEVLGNLSLLIRKRKMMFKKVHAITAEGRFTGWVLGALPVLVALAIQAMDPNYMLPLFYTPSGHFVLGLTVTTVLIGILVIRKMVDLEI